MVWGDGYDQLCCPVSPKLLLGFDLRLGCDNKSISDSEATVGIDISTLCYYKDTFWQIFIFDCKTNEIHW